MEKNIVTKSNELNEARYQLSLTEQKLILTVVSMIQPDDKNFKIYELSVHDFIKIANLKSKSNYARLKSITKNLLSKNLTIIKTKENKELQVPWFSSIEYTNGKGLIEFSFDPKLKPYFMHLKKCFVSYSLKNVLSLKSSYSIRIYELLKQYSKIGKRSFKIEELKNILCSKYQKYNDFKRNILHVSQEELKEKTDISFDFEEVKKGRSISEIIFYIKSNSKKNPVNQIEFFCTEYQVPINIQKEMLKELEEGESVNEIINKFSKEYGF